MQATLVAIAIAGGVAAGEAEVSIEVRAGPPIEGTLPETAPLRVETRYGILAIPVSDLVSIDPKEGLALAQAGLVRGRLEWKGLTVTTKYGKARLTLDDAVRITWKRERSPPKAMHYFELRDGTSLGGTIGPGAFDFATAYGALRIPLTEVRLLARVEPDCRLRLADMTLRGEPRVEVWTVDTAYGALRVPGGDVVRLASRPVPMEGDHLEGGYVVRAAGTRGGSAYALVARDPQMTWPEASDLARRMGGHLATVGEDAENDFLLRLVQRSGEVHAWIGFSDEGHEGDWRWVTGEPLRYTNWNGGEPNNAGGREDHCDFLAGSAGRWNDADGRTARVACLVEIDS